MAITASSYIISGNYTPWQGPVRFEFVDGYFSGYLRDNEGRNYRFLKFDVIEGKITINAFEGEEGPITMYKNACNRFLELLEAKKYQCFIREGGVVVVNKSLPTLVYNKAPYSFYISAKSMSKFYTMVDNAGFPGNVLNAFNIRKNIEQNIAVNKATYIIDDVRANPVLAETIESIASSYTLTMTNTATAGSYQIVADTNNIPF